MTPDRETLEAARAALGELSRYQPCPHSATVGAGFHWLKCEDCGRTVPKEHRAAEAVAKFEAAEAHVSAALDLLSTLLPTPDAERERGIAERLEAALAAPDQNVRIAADTDPAILAWLTTAEQDLRYCLGRIRALEAEAERLRALLCTDGTAEAALVHLGSVLLDAGIGLPACDRAPTCASLHLTARIHRLADERDAALRRVAEVEGERIRDLDGVRVHLYAAKDLAAIRLGHLEAIRDYIHAHMPKGYASAAAFMQARDAMDPADRDLFAKYDAFIDKIVGDADQDRDTLRREVEEGRRRIAELEGEPTLYTTCIRAGCGELLPKPCPLGLCEKHSPAATAIAILEGSHEAE